jgi:hypothetical protein
MIAVAIEGERESIPQPAGLAFDPEDERSLKRPNMNLIRGPRGSSLEWSVRQQ